MEARGIFYLDSSPNPGRALLCRVAGLDNLPGDLPISAVQLTFATATSGLATLDTTTCARFFNTKHSTVSANCARYEVLVRRLQ